MDAIAQPLLEVAGLHVRYGELVALRDVSLTVAEGEVVCIIGPNGAGKSTLLAAVAGGVTPDKGTIRFQGHNLVNCRRSVSHGSACRWCRRDGTYSAR